MRSASAPAMCRSCCRSGLRRPTPTSRSRRRSAPARSNSSRRSGFRATRRSLSGTRITCRARSFRASPAAARWQRPTASNGAISPTRRTAAAALNAGEADWYEQPPADLVPVFAANKDIVVTTVDPLGNHGILRFNHIQPPFENLKLREAVLNLVDQKDYMGAAAGDPKYWKTCASLFGCGTPFETTAGADPLLKGPNPAKAKQLIQEAGYKGEKIVLLSATAQPIVHGQALVTLDALRKAGLNVELQANDWGTLITRRTSKEPVEKGGWSIFQ